MSHTTELCDFLLIYPPVSKPAEPAAGPAQIQRALNNHGVSTHFYDANIEALLYLLDTPLEPENGRIETAFHNRYKNIENLQTPETFKKFDHYKRSVLELNRLYSAFGKKFTANINLSDFKQKGFLPAKSQDLLKAAEHPEQNPFYQFYIDKICPLVVDKQPKYIGISLIYLSQAVCSFALIGLLRKQFPHIKIILGGGLLTSWMSQPTWKNPFSGLVDICLAGPGEEALLNYFGIQPNATFFKPDYSTVSFSRYMSPGKILPFTTSYGCYWRKCKFCPECAEENPYHPIPQQQVLDDLQELIAEQSPQLLHFLDNALAPALVHKFENAHFNTPWYGYMRFEKSLESLEFCQSLKASGCALLQLGLESGNQDVLNDMGKGIELQRVSRILGNLKQVGISTFIYLLFGTPFETEQQAEHTLTFVEEHAECIQYINAAIFNLPLFSDEAACHNTHYFYKGDLTLYTDFEHPHGWQRKKVRTFLQEKLQRHPVLQTIVKASPPSFTSNHAAFFEMGKSR